MSESASDEQLDKVLECPREVYIEGDANLRAAFAESTIKRFTERELVYQVWWGRARGGGKGATFSLCCAGSAAALPLRFC